MLGPSLNSSTAPAKFQPRYYDVTSVMPHTSVNVHYYYKACWKFNGILLPILASSSFFFPTDNRSADSFMYIIALGMYYEITISLKIHVMDFNSSSGQHALSLVGKVRRYNANWSTCTFSLLQNGRLSSGTFTIWRWRTINYKIIQRLATVTLSQTMRMLYSVVERMKTLINVYVSK
jgi:hypothetical protein